MMLDLKKISLGLVVIMFVSSAVGGLILWKTGYSIQIADPLEAGEYGYWTGENLLPPLDDAKSANVNIELKVGTLEIEDGPKNLLNAKTRYSLAPEISYNIHNGVTDIKISQAGHIKNLKNHSSEDLEDRWNLQFNEDIPLNLTADLVLSDAYLRLGKLNLTRVDLDVAMGNVYIELTERPVLKWINMNNIASRVTLDLTGDWKSDLNATVNISMGDIELMLPSRTGVRIRAELDPDTIEHARLKRMGEYYVNEAFARSNSTLYLDLSAHMSNIELR